MFYARFVPNPAAQNIYPWLSNLGNFEQGVSFKIKTIDKPKLDLSLTELNQYNRKRFAYTKVEYSPLTIRMHDTVDNQPLTLWKDYFLYYFGDSRALKSGSMGDPVTAPTFNDGTGWGLRPVSNDIYFFNRLELYSIFGKRFTQVNYLNPKIASIDWEQYDSSSSDTDEVTMSLRYEALEYIDEGDITVDMASMFGFDAEYPVNDPVDTRVANIIPTKNRPGVLTTYASLTNNTTAQTPINSTSSVMTDMGLNNAATQAFLSQNASISSQPLAGNADSYANNANNVPNIQGIPGGALPDKTTQVVSTNTLSSSPVVSSQLAASGAWNYGNA
jgi:hypothetical protein